MPSSPAVSHQEGTQHVEADKIVVGKVRAAGVLLARCVVRRGVTQLARAAGQQDLLPRLPCRTPGREGLLLAH